MGGLGGVTCREKSWQVGVRGDITGLCSEQKHMRRGPRGRGSPSWLKAPVTAHLRLHPTGSKGPMFELTESLLT